MVQSRIIHFNDASANCTFIERPIRPLTFRFIVLFALLMTYSSRVVCDRVYTDAESDYNDWINQSSSRKLVQCHHFNASFIEKCDTGAVAWILDEITTRHFMTELNKETTKSKFCLFSFAYLFGYFQAVPNSGCFNNVRVEEAVCHYCLSSRS